MADHRFPLSDHELRRIAGSRGFRLHARRRDEEPEGVWIGDDEIDAIRWRWSRGEYEEALILLGRAIGEDFSISRRAA